MNVGRQLWTELRNIWRVSAGLAVVLVGVFLVQRPDRVVTRAVAAGGPAWLVTVYAVAVPAFGAAFVVFLSSAYAAVEDDAENIYHRLLVYPVPFSRLLLVKTLPVAVCGTGAALVLGGVAYYSLPRLGLVTVLAAVAVVGVAAVPVAVLVTLWYLWIDDPRIGTVVVFAVVSGGVVLSRLGPLAVSASPVTLALGGVAAVVVSYGVAAVALVGLDLERLVVG